MDIKLSFYELIEVPMGKNTIKSNLISQTKRKQIAFFGKNIAQLDVVVFQCAFLSGLHGITIENTGSQCAVRAIFEGVGG